MTLRSLANAKSTKSHKADVQSKIIITVDPCSSSDDHFIIDNKVAPLAAPPATIEQDLDSRSSLSNTSVFLEELHKRKKLKAKKNSQHSSNNIVLIQVTLNLIEGIAIYIMSNFDLGRPVVYVLKNIVVIGKRCGIYLMPLIWTLTHQPANDFTAKKLKGWVAGLRGLFRRN